MRSYYRHLRKFSNSVLKNRNLYYWLNSLLKTIYDKIIWKLCFDLFSFFNSKIIPIFYFFYRCPLFHKIPTDAKFEIKIWMELVFGFFQFVDRRCVIAYLIQERLPVFEKTTLFLEYLLCCRLRDVEVDFDNKTFKGTLPVKCQHLEVHAIVWLETGGEGRGKFKTNFPIAFPLALPYGLAKDASYLHDLTWV